MQALEMVRFVLKDGHEEAFLQGRPAMLDALRRNFPAAGDAFLGKLGDGTWVDVVVWESRDAAEAAAKEVSEHAEIAAWFANIDVVVSMDHVDVHAVDRHPG